MLHAEAVVWSGSAAIWGARAAARYAAPLTSQEHELDGKHDAN
jgi:hypothetical protein